jgi:hypothetical protein
MLQKLGDHIANCLARADDADRRGSEVPDLEALRQKASGWPARGVT